MGLPLGLRLGYRIGYYVLILLVHETVAKQGYLLTVPNRLVPGKEENVCITFSESLTSIVVVYTLKSISSNNAENVYATSRAAFSSRVGGCTTIRLPDAISDYAVVLAVQGNSSNGYSFKGQKRLSVLSMSHELTLIQTDKPVYKPGQTVRFRLFTLTTDLLPVLDQVYKVWIEDPSGVHIEQWLNVSTELGISELSFKLASEPPLGTWTIKCNVGKRSEQATFRVDEYVLPKFEVTIKPPPYVSPRTKFVTGEICARYTYGQPVQGQLHLRFEITNAYTWYFRQDQDDDAPPYTMDKEINGCYSFNISKSDVGLTTELLSSFMKKMVIKAHVTELGTGIRINATDTDIKMEYHDVNIDIVGNDKLKPGLGYSGQVKVSLKNGSPLPQQIVNISIKDERWNVVANAVELTDDNGVAAFTLPAMGRLIHAYTVQAALGKSSDYTDGAYLPETRKEVTPWYSPSGSYLQLIAPPPGSLRCGEMAKVEMEYTTNFSQAVDLSIQVMGLNNIELNTQQTVVFNPQQKIPWIAQVEADFEAQNDTADASAGSMLNEGHHDARRRSIIYDRPTHRNDKKPVEGVQQTYRGRTSISFRVSSRMAPAPRLLVFYVRPDGEVVADDITLAVEECTSNEVKMSFSAETARPGEAVNIQLTAGSRSLCTFGVVDKSVNLMDSSNQLSLRQLYNKLQLYQLSRYTGSHDEESGDQQYCERQLLPSSTVVEGDKGKGDDANATTPPPWLSWRRKMWKSYYSLYHDASHAFEGGASAVLTDLTLNTRPCAEQRRFLYPLSYMARTGEGPVMAMPMAVHVDGKTVDDSSSKSGKKANVDTEYKPSVEIRTYFPETWLWDTTWLDENGKAYIKQIVPHTITEWQGSAACTHPEHGFGISAMAAVTAFQPFFVSVELPYSVIRGETVPVAVTVYNYLSECVVVEVILKATADFDVKGSRNINMCICGKESRTHHYLIVTKAIGDVNITVTSKSVSSSNGASCPPGAIMSTLVGVRDAVVRTLLVEPEGAPREYTLSSYVCVRPGQGTVTESYSLALPNDTVSQSARAYVSVVGDIMGPSLSNLDSLLRMPWGCGEQNMVGFAPNIFVMQYLEATHQASDAIRSKAVEYMKSGYQRQLTYSHADNSYSAFGKTDASGSIWLTAFVVKCFSQARPYIYIDNDNLQKSINYFRIHQLENGCFPEVGRVLSNYMKGGQADDTSGQAVVTLTAYIVVALLEAGVSPQDEVVRNAVGCLDIQSAEDSYTLALLGYAYSLYDVGAPRRAEIMDKLKAKAIITDGTMHWERDASAKPTSAPSISWFPKPVSADVEMTSYALLALLRQSDGVPAGLTIVRWLSKQRNAYGGFASTQDTVLAIQALAKFASATYVSGTQVGIRVTAGDFQKAFATTKDNSLVLQSTQLPSLPVENLDFNITGQGCALVQANVRYNVKTYSLPGPAFVTRVSVHRLPKSGPSGCKKQVLSICTQYKGRGGISNMAIVDVKMVSGWLPDKESLRALQSITSVQLKRYEISDKTVSLYFEQITRQEKCFRFDVTQEQQVTDAKPGIITTYDYYDTELRHETSYTLDACAKAKEASGNGDSIKDRTVISDLADIMLLSLDSRQAAFNGCPLCEQSVNLTLVCLVKHAYKVNVLRAAPPQLQLMADLGKPTKKIFSNTNASYSVGDQCTCKPLSDAVAMPGTKLLITYDRNVAANIQDGVPAFDLSEDKTAVFPLTRHAEVALHQAIKRCRQQRRS